MRPRVRVPGLALRVAQHCSGTVKSEVDVQMAMQCKQETISLADGTENKARARSGAHPWPCHDPGDS